MGKRNETGQHCSPVDQYRKQIGKQDWKKSKKDIKFMKTRAVESNELTPQRIVMMIGLVITVMSAVYALFVWSLSTASSEQMRSSQPT